MFTNVCMFTGRLVEDPKTTKTQNDVSVANFTLAVECRRYKNSQGEWCSDTQFFDFEIWDSGADNFAGRFRKGDLVGVCCSARVAKWTDKETEKERRAVRFRVDQFEMLKQKESNRSSESTADSEPVTAGTGSDIPF